ncbi:MAG: hypothetical protein HC817_04790 [Saprospiraceae bacterium]|nr:hypothetical protein [Saprospiraceae bacterium]
MSLIETTTFEEVLKLNPSLKLTVYVNDAIDLTPINGAKVEIREAATNKLVATEILRGNVLTTNSIEFGKSYRLYGYKETYEADTNNLLMVLDHLSNKFEYVDTLFLTPFNGLPLVLYFDNDYPNPNTRDSITYLTYGQTFDAYYAKLPEYQRGYFRSNKNVSVSGSNEITDFFNNEIKANYDKLNIFTSLLKKYLVSGKRVQIEIEGFASPLAKMTIIYASRVAAQARSKITFLRQKMARFVLIWLRVN